MTMALFLAACSKDRVHKMVVSVADQKMALYKRGALMKLYDISTSRFCLSTKPGTNGTPLGQHEVGKKIGGGQPSGMKFSSRRPTGEIVPVNAPGRDPIVTRILWLKGVEASNRTSFSRTIYIHGTPEERRIGHPASYGCVRMRSRDIIELYDIVGEGAAVEIVTNPLALPPPPPVMAPVPGVQVAQVATPSTTPAPAPAKKAAGTSRM